MVAGVVVAAVVFLAIRHRWRLLLCMVSTGSRALVLTIGLVIGLGEFVITYGNGNILGDTTVTHWLAVPPVSIAILGAGHSHGW